MNKIEPIEIAFSRNKLLFWLVVSSLLTVGCFMIGLFSEGDVFLLFIATISVPFFFFLVWFAFSRLQSNEPALRIDEEGIFENSNALSVGMIEWGQIDHVELNANQSIVTIAVFLKDPTYWIKNERNLFKKAIRMMNWKLDKTPIHINDMMLSTTIIELLTEIKKREWEGLPFEDLSKHLVDE